MSTFVSCTKLNILLTYSRETHVHGNKFWLYYKEEYIESLFWHVFQIAKAHFKYTIWFMISVKSITRCTFLRGVSVPLKISPKYTTLCTRISTSFSSEITFIWTISLYSYVQLHTYRRPKFQDIFQRELWIALGSCYMFT